MASCASLPDLPALAREWKDLEARADAPFFLTWLWIGCWLESVKPKDALLLRATRDGMTIGLAIWVPRTARRHGFVRSRTLQLHRTGDPALDEMWIEYNAYLCARGEEAAVAAAFAEILIALPDWDELVAGASSEDWLGMAKPHGLACRRLWGAPSFRTDLETVRTAGGIGKLLSSNSRHQLNLALKGYAAHGALTLAAARTADEALDFLDAAGDLHRQRWNRKGKKGGFENPVFTAFHRRLIETAVPEGGAEILRISAGPEAIGYLYVFLHQKTASFYLSGLSYCSDPHLKPGLVSHALAIGHYAERGFSAYDFMGGDARYKRSLGIRGPDLAIAAWQRPRLKLRFEGLARNLRNQIMRRPQG